MNKFYSLEITTTTNCNFRCSYCFENDKNCPEKNIISQRPDVLIGRIKELLTSNWFKNNLGFLRITFWGGEPLINIDLINYIVGSLKSFPNVCYFVYTNVSLIEKLLPILERFR